jgi:hypothetical protein
MSMKCLDEKFVAFSDTFYFDFKLFQLSVNHFIV